MRREFRSEIENKDERDVVGIKGLKSVMFHKDKGRFSFDTETGDKERLKGYLADYFGINKERILDEIIGRMSLGEIIIYKDWSEEKQQVLVRSTFIIPALPYWHRLTDLDRIEDIFAVYNTSVELGRVVGGKISYVYLQTEGTFMGITSSVNIPIKFILEPENRVLRFDMPTQEEIMGVAERIKPLDPGRSSVKEGFIDLCRLHPIFAEKDEKGRYLIRDKEIKEILDKVVLKMEKECEVKGLEGMWRFYEDFPGFYLVTYGFSSVVNVAAFVPNIPFVRGLVKKAAQVVSDEVSVKYLPLSMKNLRDAVIGENKKTR